MILGAIGTLPAFFLDWFAIYRSWARAKYITKPLALVILMGWFAVTNFSRPHEPITWLILAFFFSGLLLSLGGDIFLLLSGRYFIGGLLAFLAAHLAYIASLRPWETTLEPAFLAWVAVIFTFSTFFFRLLYKKMATKDDGQKLVGPMAIYVAAISLMLLSAVSTLFRPDWLLLPALLVCVGGILFYASDGLLAYNKFVCTVPNCCLKVRVLYHMGQLGLASGLTLQLWLTAL